MSAYTLISGVLTKAPESRLSKNGNQFAMANVRVKDGDAQAYWRVFAFSEPVVAELLRLGEGEAVSLSGSMKAELYQPEGKPARVSMTINADAVLSLKPKPKEKAEKPKAPYVPRTVANLSASQPQPATDLETALNDAVPF